MAKKNKRQQNIKSKLMAAVCMLLVSSIMMVSSTYAWFTLSTAPEVTGIQTAVGANGSLEIALVPEDGDLTKIDSKVGDSILEDEARNITWGNLVDLSDSTIYGLDKLTLYPAALNAAASDAAGNPTSLATALLKTPAYGADGRVSQLQENTFTGTYNSTSQSFYPDATGTTTYGVRAVGTASGMTDRQLDYRNARSAANTATAQARTTASQSLNNNGSALANIAIEHGMASNTEAYDSTDVTALRNIINDLKGNGSTITGALQYIETAYMQYILAYAASAESGTEDTAWTAVAGEVEKEGATLDSVIAMLTTNNVSLPDALNTAIEKYEETVAKVEEANSALGALENVLASDANATFTWTEISGAMTPLANASAMKINGYEVSDVKNNLGDVVSSITSQGGLKVSMPTGGGVYADIADQSGDFTASVNIEKVEYNSIVLNNMAARMETASTVTPSYLAAIGTAVEGAGAPANGVTGTLPISDAFGYVIDMAFRTNAAESNLLLQVDAVDRIYESNQNGVELGDDTTMGGGSSMTFKATTTDFSNQQLKDLMSAIRIVFFTPGTSNTVLATAKLDTANATLGTEGWTAKMYLYEMTSTSTTTYAAATAEQITAGKDLYVQVTGEDNSVSYTAATQEQITAGTDLYFATTTTSAATETKLTDNVITALTQNTATQVSVLVYLDGNSVSNGSVAATAATSMTGTMNLQFASSANLVPMDYTPLMEQTGGAEAGGEEAGGEEAGGEVAG